MPGRADWEVQTFFGAWLLTGLAVLATSSLAPRRVWSAASAAASALFLAVPVLGELATGHHLIASSSARNAAFAGFDAVMLCVGAGFGLAAYTLARRWSDALPIPRTAPRSRVIARLWRSAADRVS